MKRIVCGRRINLEDISKFCQSCTKANEDGLCKADCCGFVPISKKVIEENKHKIQVKIENRLEGETEDYLLTNDLFCAFLNRETKKCMIYEQRPKICKIYGVSKDERLRCPHFKPNGNPWSEAMKKRVERMINRMSKEFLAKGERYIKKDLK